MGSLEDFVHWQRRKRSWRASGRARASRWWFLPTPTELILTCVVAALIAAGWLRWAPIDSTDRAVTAQNVIASSAPIDSTDRAVTAQTVVASSAALTGRASVIDGDTIEIRGERVRVLDIDAPESRQTCTKPNGEQWRCGQKAALALADWIGSRTVACDTAGKDRYDRWLARCTVGGADMGEWLAANGWVVPYRDCHCETIRDAAKRAKAAQLGIWLGSFVMPWDWRAGNATSTQNVLPQSPAQSSPQAVAGCRIKGNINSKGDRIYHVPGSRWYDQTKIDQSKGERWFCSEAEAVAAGWRAPRG